jgi:hypothetical protein
VNQEEEEPKDDPPEERDGATEGVSGEDTVAITNRTRRPVHFSFAGRTVRLGPGETFARAPVAAKHSSDVKALCARGVLSMFAVASTGTIGGVLVAKGKPKLDAKATGRRGK